MDANLNIPAIEKLIEYTASGIGSIAAPLLAPWKAGREAKAKKIAARGEIEVRKILVEGRADTMQIIASAHAEARGILVSPNSLVEGEIEIGDAIAQRIQFQEEKRHSNIRAVVQQAAVELGDNEVPDIEPNHDWVARAFNEIQDVSSEEMQRWWAKVLTGEIQRPGSVSLLALDILRNLDQSAAVLFRRFCSLCVLVAPDGDTIVEARVPSLGGNASDNALKEYGLGFHELNVLNEHRLIISDYHSWRDYKPFLGIKGNSSSSPSLFIPITTQGQHWILSPTMYYTRSKDFKVHGVALTHSGRNLLKIVDIEPAKEYLHGLKSFFMRYGISMSETNTPHPQVNPSLLP